MIIYAFSDVTGNVIRPQSHVNFAPNMIQTTRGAKTEKTESIILLAAFAHSMDEITSSSGETPIKTLVSSSSGCLLCDTEQSDSRKKTSLKGKVKDIAQRVANVLDIPLDGVDVERYLCNDRCYKNIKRIEKCQEEVRSLKNDIKDSFASANRFKRGVPSDSSISPSIVAPTKSARRSTNTARPGMAKSLNFASIDTEEGQHGMSALPDIMPLVTLPSEAVHPPAVIPVFVPIATNLLNEGFCEGNIVKVQAVVTYESGKKTGELPTELHRLGKALARGSNFKALADAAMDSPQLKEAIEKKVCVDISKECKILCSTANPSLLRNVTKDSMLNFSWKAVGTELETKAPIFFRCIMAAADPTSNTRTTSTFDPVKHPGVYTAASILLKKRDKAMSLVPYIISTVLKVGKTSKTAFVRLNHLGVTMSPKSVNKALDLIGEDYDAKLHEWKDRVFQNLSEKVETIQERERLELRKQELNQQLLSGEEVGTQMTELEAAASCLDNTISKLEEECPSSFNIVLDNIDLKVLASDMTSDNQNKDYHWCNHNAHLDRVNPVQLENDEPIANLQDVPNSAFLPSLDDQNSLLSDFVILVGRVIVESLPEFSIFKDVVPLHIKHKYSDELKKKTETVNLGVLFKNENLGEEMIDIVRELHELVPTVEVPGGEEAFDRVPVVGDQKTMERGVEAQFSVRNAYTKSRRLEGLFFQLADWHHENKFLSLIFSRYYSGSSACDKTSLFALRNLVNWRDVVTDAQQKPAPCKRFMDLILDADIIAAALVFFGMADVNDSPTKHGFSNEMENNIRAVRARYFSKVMKEFIMSFIVDGTLYEKHFANIHALEEWEAVQRNQPVLDNGRYPCRFPGCSSSFKHDGLHRMRHELSHDPPPSIPEEPPLESTVPDPTDENPEPKDDVFDYHCGFMNMALLLRNFKDAIKEGDGDRIIKCIKMFLLHFKEDGSGSTKYSLEALYLLFQVNALLSPREAERLKWNRTVNNQGGEGNNVAMDVALEHDNHALKEIIRGLGANISEQSVLRVCRAFFVLMKLHHLLDSEISVKEVSGKHTKKSVKEDLMKVVKTLTEQHVFEKQPTREPMYCFPDCPRDYLQLLKTKELFGWINDHKKNVSLEKRPR